MDIGKYLVREIDRFNIVPGSHNFSGRYQWHHAANPFADPATSYNFPFQLFRWIADAGTDQETIKLRFRQQKSAALVRGILCCKHHKWFWQGVRHTFYRHAPLFHRLKHSTLCAGHGTVDLIQQNDIVEDRPWLKREVTLFAIKD